MNEVKLAVIGAGVIGKRHLKAISAVAQAKLVAIVDSDPRAKKIAAAVDAPFYETTGTMFRDLEPDGVVISTPTDHHLQPLLECLQAGTHVLVEKPIAATMKEAEAVVAVSEKVSRHVPVGYHRRYYENIQETRRLIQNGTLGQLVGVCGQWTVRKADTYFETDWRQLRTAGPVMINLSHEIDTLRFVCGEIGSLSAKIRSGIRGHPKEETAALLLNFECGALGTFLLSDTNALTLDLGTCNRRESGLPQVRPECLPFCWLGGSTGFSKFDTVATQWQYCGLEPPNDRAADRHATGRCVRSPMRPLLQGDRRSGTASDHSPRCRSQPFRGTGRFRCR